MRRLPWLDWVRFWASFMVLACHARGSTWTDWSTLPQESKTTVVKIFYALTRAGLEWVVIFFVLSGFLVGGGTIRKVADRNFQPGWFALDRITRIWVPLIPALAFTLVVAALCDFTFSLGDLAGNLLGLQGILCPNFGHNEPLWSLGYEIWFYVIAGSVAATWHSGPSRRAYAIVFLTIGMSAFLWLSPWLLCCWAIGACCSLAGKSKVHLAGPLPWLAITIAGAAISQLLSGTRIGLSLSSAEITHGRYVALLVESVGAGLFFSAITRSQPSRQAIAYIDIAGEKFAALSYTLYLIHYPTLQLWEHFGPGKMNGFGLKALLLFVVKILSCLVVAQLLYLAFESRTTSIRERLRGFIQFVFMRHHKRKDPA